MYCLPGVPREMNYLLEHAVLPHLRRVFAPEAVIRVRILHTAGAGESRVDERLADLETAANPSVGLAARAGLVDVRLTAKAATEAEALGLMAPVEAEVRSRLGDWVFGADGASLAGVCLEGLARRGWRLAAAECGVAGALARRLGRGAQGTAGPGGRAAPSALAAAEVLPPGAGWDAPALATATRDRWRTDVGLAVVLTSTADQRPVEVALVTPAGARSGERRLGGHPGQGPAWAANMALALLRQGVSTSPLEADNAS
ncbi:MAG: hypothetical protein ACE5EL_07010 [Anaerolineae bacterium]